MDPYLGEIRIFAGSFAPEYWMICNGAALTIKGNEALYSLIGTRWGGDGVNTFNIPDLRATVPIGQGPSPQGTQRVLGQTGGSEAVILTTEQMPQHTHGFTATTKLATTASPAGNTLAAPVCTTNPNLKAVAFLPSNIAGGNLAPMNPQIVSNEGGSASHANVMPSVVVNYIICVLGNYPQPAN